MDNKALVVVVLLILIIIVLLFWSGVFSKSDLEAEYYQCKTDSDCPAGYCRNGKCRECDFDSDCPNKADYCYNGLCEPSGTGRQPCLDRLTTGNIVVTKHPTDFGDLPVQEECFFFLGDSSNAMVSQRFSATWSDAQITRAGGYILTWGGPTGVKNDQGKIAVFDTNYALVPQYEFLSQGGFPLSKQASIPCHQMGNPVNVRFTVQPINIWQEVPNVDWSKTGDIIDVTWDALAIVDKYVVSAKVERLQVIDPDGDVEIFPVTYAYHGGMTDRTSMVIELPSYFFDNAEIMSEYGLVVEIRVYGFRSCNLNDPVIGSVITTLA